MIEHLRDEYSWLKEDIWEKTLELTEKQKEQIVAIVDSTPVYGPTNPSPEQKKNMPVKRFGSMIGLDPEKEQYYRELHAGAWTTVVDRIRKSNIRNYSIYVSEIRGQKYLFSYFEYIGTDIQADMKAMADDPQTQRWWKETDPCQIRLPGRQPGANWSDMEMVFFTE